MIFTTAMLLDRLSGYQDPFGRIRRLCREEKLHQITKGLYESSADLDGKLLASVLYGPSYLSFSYALSYYGLIPEGIREYTSATCGNGKKKYYHNDFGDYSYRDIPFPAFPYETKHMEEDGYVYSIATPEKALCDKLYEVSPVRNLHELEILLFDDLRIDEDAFSELNQKTVQELSALYHSGNVRFLSTYLRRRK